MTAGKNFRVGAAVFRIKTAEALQYNVAWLANSLVGTFWGLIEITVYTVFFTYANASYVQSAALTLAQTVSYVWLAQAFFVSNAMMGMDGEIVGKINSGDIGFELCRPMDLYTYWYAKIFGGRFAPLVWRGLPVLLVGMVLPASYRISGPASIGGLLLMIISMLAAMLLSVAFNMLLLSVRIGIAWGDGPVNMILLFAGVLSGGYLPLQLWPDFMQKFLLFQPFAGYMDIPLRFYVGSANMRDAWQILVQMGWTAIFILLGRAVMKSRLKSVVIQGG
ncbi:MAG: hypothetical protein FWE82_03750 [Defluviitaleaceae bacterium]|nr:hypothetical protein [Defluviitaleaceae bacterium]